MGKKIVFIPLDSYGHVNACTGIAEKIKNLGHEIIFILEQCWAGEMKSLGFKEELFVDPVRPPGLKPNEYWVNSMDLIADTIHEDSLYKAGHQSLVEFEEFIMHEFNFDDQIERILNKIQPDLIILDHYITLPAVYKSPFKWIQMTSAGPLSCLPHPDLPPSGSGYPVNGDREQWRIFEEVHEKHHKPCIDKYINKLKEFGIENLPPSSLCFPSPWLNIYAYPEELDYTDIRPLPPKWKRFDHFIRSFDTMSKQKVFTLPEQFKELPGKLIYVSMGSMGGKMESLIDSLVKLISQSPHRFIFVMGPNYGKFKLSPNILGGEYFPQLQILPLVDLFITHGGNNSVLEGLYFGKPLLVSPLFADQNDNAQRLTETGYGNRMNAFTIESKDFNQLIDSLVNDSSMKTKLENISKRLQSSSATDKVAEAILEIC